MSLKPFNTAPWTGASGEPRVTRRIFKSKSNSKMAMNTDNVVILVDDRELRSRVVTELEKIKSVVVKIEHL